jgi:PKD repeat protein
MSKVKNSILLVTLIGAGLLVGVGCPKPSPTPPDYIPFFIASPTELDFGTDTSVLTLKIAKNYTSQPLPTFQVTSSSTWIQISPPTGNSTGPSDPATFTITIDRTKLSSGTNTGALVVATLAPGAGIAPLSIPVSATSRISADFEAAPLAVSLGQGVDFTDLSSVAPGEAPINSWTWDFGDGTQSLQQHPQQHVYPAQGMYTVTLTVSNGTLTDTAQKVDYITVEGPSFPVANFSAAETMPIVGEPVHFEDLSDPGSAAQIDSWFWQFGDGNTSTDQDPDHTYNQIANFTVSLTVTTTVGEDTLTRPSYIQVQPKGPTALFDADDKTPGVGQPVQFTDLSDPGSAAQIDTWLWNFGDGGSSIAQNPMHTYTAVATYTVSLQVTATSGSDTATISNFINVHAKKLLERQGGAE